MSTVVPATDTMLVNRAGIDYRTTVDQMSTLQDTDLLLVNRAGVDYRCTAADVKAAVGGGGAGGNLIYPASIDQALDGADLNQWRTAYAANPGVGRLNMWLGVGEKIIVTFDQPVVGFILTGGNSGAWQLTCTDMNATTNFVRLQPGGSANFFTGGHSATNVRFWNTVSTHLTLSTLGGLTA
jgi:hypothetical protein